MNLSYNLTLNPLGLNKSYILYNYINNVYKRSNSKHWHNESPSKEGNWKLAVAINVVMHCIVMVICPHQINIKYIKLSGSLLLKMSVKSNIRNNLCRFVETHLFSSSYKI